MKDITEMNYTSLWCVQDFQREAKIPVREIVVVQWSARVAMAGTVYMVLPAGDMAAHGREGLVSMPEFRISSNGLKARLAITEGQREKGRKYDFHMILCTRL